ncbi:hypothetical protein JYU34_012183 [Plutella xylostella]|uniref:Uncharacterized protein n=1 Tax=Plutella xylostella TaxID=51655 RepID=A0ABQ7QEL1_PLUXY|nr:hypothetical protein JYU34_012183 [Plutella xylostella]
MKAIISIFLRERIYATLLLAHACVLSAKPTALPFGAGIFAYRGGGGGAISVSDSWFDARPGLFASVIDKEPVRMRHSSA